MCWNARGAVCTKFKNTVMNLIHNHHVDLLFICEPRISGTKAASVVKSLGFSCSEVVDAVGFSGGLWLLWNENKFKVDIIGTHEQAISACITWPGQTPWVFTAVYAKPCSIKRATLWEYLSFVADCHNMPWLLAGDFNEMLQLEVKLGGGPLRRIKGFKSWFDANDLIDLGFTGQKFTWSNNRVFERLDRAICNMSWMGAFLEANVIHLPRTKSDHCPIKINLQSCFLPSPRLRPFRF
ncbi:uncharacterized protein LOC110769479 [Prunus avium]|uniref:Uncharacterized protein LOC110769479 n=1 Tax=Prunus avium TaxID=42229 RepID=A0A6P5TPZ4_PRUAV|nr:uncharacterized protein LOC110769479 [Prunus avium]